MKISRARGGADGHTWRSVPLTDYEANLLRQLAADPTNAGWPAKLLGQIAERFKDAPGVRL